MWIRKSYDPFEPFDIRWRFSSSQRFVEPISTAAFLGGSAISAGGQIAGAYIGAQPGKLKVHSTLSRNQKQFDRLIFDFLMGIERNSKGHEISRNPILSKLKKRRVPRLRRAGYSDAQKDVLNIAKGMIPKATNLKRPDLSFVDDQRRGILGAALGASQAGEPIVVGEDGPEVVIPENGGTVTVIPNPKSVANPREALAKSLAVTAQTGLKGKATGNDPHRKLLQAGGQNYYLDPSWGDVSWNVAYGGKGSPEQEAFNVGFLDYLGTLDANDSRYVADITRPGRFAKEQRIYGNRMDQFENRYGGDFYNLNLKQNPKTGRYANPTTRWFQDQAVAYAAGLPDATSNTGVDAELARLVEGGSSFDAFARQLHDFETSVGGQPFKGVDIVFEDGQLKFANPYDIDVGNLRAAVNTHLAGLPGAGAGAGDDGTADNPFFVGPMPPSPEDQGEGRLTDDGTPRDPVANEVIDSLLPLLLGLSGDKFKADEWGSEFETGVAEPARERFEGETIPSINEQYASGANLFGSSREKAIRRAEEDLNRDLRAEQSRFVLNSRTDFESRRKHAIDTAMTLSQLPAEIANKEANTELVRASITNVFANIEIQEAIVNANLTNSDLANMMTIWDLLGDDQMERNAEFQHEFKELLTGEQGFTLSGMLGLMTQYNQQTHLTSTVT